MSNKYHNCRLKYGAFLVSFSLLENRLRDLQKLPNFLSTQPERLYRDEKSQDSYFLKCKRRLVSIEELSLVEILVKRFYSTQIYPVLPRYTTSLKSRDVKKNLYIITPLLFQQVNITMIYIDKNFKLLYILQRSIVICSIYKKYEL